MSFKRNNSKTQQQAGAAGAPSERISGIKPWINSQYFVSYGLRQLDEYLGGGNALGTVCAIEEDHLSNHASVMFNYSLAESLSHNHPTMLIVEDQDAACDIISQLPCNLNYTGTGVSLVATSLVDDLTNEFVRKLNIHWASDADVATSSSSGSASSYASIAATGVVYCNSFDLSRRLQIPMLQEYSSNLRVVCGNQIDLNIDASTVDNADSLTPEVGTTGRTLGEMSAVLLRSVAQFVAVYGSAGRVGRIFLPRLDLLINSCSDVGVSASGRKCGSQVAKLVLALKQLVAGSRVSLMLSFLPSAMPGATMVASLCDTLLCVESFAGKESTVPVEFKLFCGYLHVKRIQQANSIASYRAGNCKYGIKRDRRKLHIEPLHLPPEESRAMQSSNSVRGGNNNSASGNASNKEGSSSGASARPKTSYSSGMSCAPGNAESLQF